VLLEESPNPEEVRWRESTVSVKLTAQDQLALFLSCLEIFSWPFSQDSFCFCSITMAYFDGKQAFESHVGIVSVTWNGMEHHLMKPWTLLKHNLPLNVTKPQL